MLLVPQLTIVIDDDRPVTEADVFVRRRHEYAFPALRSAVRFVARHSGRPTPGVPVLDPFAKALVVYLGGAFPLALLAAICFDNPGSFSLVQSRRLLRRAQLLAVVGVAHPVLGLASLGLVRDVQRWADDSQQLATMARRTRLGATMSIAVGAMTAAAVLGITAS